MRSFKDKYDKKLYQCWADIKQRCYNKNNKKYYAYGGKGIIICDRWLNSYDNFRDDLDKSFREHIKEHGVSDTEITRIHSEGNYEPSNCKWTTKTKKIEPTKFVIKEPDKSLVDSIKKDALSFIDDDVIIIVNNLSLQQQVERYTKLYIARAYMNLPIHLEKEYVILAMRLVSKGMKAFNSYLNKNPEIANEYFSAEKIFKVKKGLSPLY